MLEVGAQDDERGLELTIPESAFKWFDESLPKLNPDGKRMIVLCPGAKHATKQWLAERWITLGQMLIQDDYQVIILGSTSEATLVQEIVSAIPQAVSVINPAIPEAAALLKKAAVVVCNDSGLMHLAAGMNTPLVAIFGPTVPEFGFFPFRANSKVIEHKLPCRPCSAMGSSSCPKKHFDCMRKTDCETVMSAVNEIIQKTE